VAPGQDDAGRHVSDDTRIVPIVAREPRIAAWPSVISVALIRLHIGAHESLDRFGRVVGDHGQAQTARTDVEILRALATRPISGQPALRSITSTAPSTGILPGRWARRPRRRRGKESPFSSPTTPREDLGRDRPSSAEVSGPAASRLVDAPSWSSNCRADVPLECVAITSAAQNHVVGGNFDRCTSGEEMLDAQYSTPQNGGC
jgi:hypothetical protein